MNINTVFQEDHQAKLTVEIEAASFQETKQRAARQISKRTRIPGFRPGKAPFAVVLRTVGEGAISQEAIDILLDEQYAKIIDEAKIKSYGPGSLSNILSMDPLTLEFLVPLMPEVALPEYDKLRKPYELKPVTDADVDEVLEDLRDRYATFEPVERPAQDGDQVSLRLSAERKSPGEGEELALIQDRSTALTVNKEGAETKSEWPFPGFSRHLAGLSAGDEKTFEYTYPEDANLQNLRGAAAIFHIKIEAVKLRKLPELNDEFAKTLGEYETLEALRSEIMAGTTEQRKSDYEREYQNALVDEILKDAQIHYPPQMLEREMDVFKRQLESRLAQQNLDMATYLKTRQLDEAGLQAELKPAAEQRLRRSLVLVEIARQENIQVDEQAVQNEAMSTINQINQYYKPEEARKMLSQDFVQNMIGNITSDLMVKNTLDRLTSIAKGELEAQKAAEAAASGEAVAQAEIEGAKPVKAKTPKKRKTAPKVEIESTEPDKVKTPRKSKPRKESV